MFHNLEEQKLYRCGLCGVTFKEKFNLLRHEKRHTGEKPYKCEICRASFPRKGSLKRHFRTHTGEKLHSCMSCDKTFAYKSSLVQHYKWHAGEKPYECYDCGKTFTRKNTLIQHIPLHTGEKPFECNYCNSVFSRKVRLLHHIWQHNGDWPYKCSYCAKGFAYRNALVTHERIHTGDRPYICKICNKAYTSKSNLGRHLRCHKDSEYEEEDASSLSPIPAEENCTRSKEELVCDICPEKFASRREPVHHMKSHPEGKRLEGEMAGKASGIPASFYNEDTPHSETTEEKDQVTEQQRWSTSINDDYGLECNLTRLSIAPDEDNAMVTNSHQNKTSAKKNHPKQQSKNRISSITPLLKHQDLPSSNQKDVTTAKERGELVYERKPKNMQRPVRQNRDTLSTHAPSTVETIVLDARTDCLTKAECDRILFSSGTVRIRSPSPCDNCELRRRGEHPPLDAERENTEWERDHTRDNLTNIDCVERVEGNGITPMGSLNTTVEKEDRHLAVKKEPKVSQWFEHLGYRPFVKEEVEFTEFTDDTF